MYKVSLSEAQLMRLMCMTEKEKYHALIHGRGELGDVEPFQELINVLNIAEYMGGETTPPKPKEKIATVLTKI